MEVILIKDIENLGYANDIVNVKPGYANNYLIPQGYAKSATAAAKKVLAENLKQRPQGCQDPGRRTGSSRDHRQPAAVAVGEGRGGQTLRYGHGNGPRRGARRQGHHRRPQADQRRGRQDRRRVRGYGPPAQGGQGYDQVLGFRCRVTRKDICTKRASRCGRLFLVDDLRQCGPAAGGSACRGFTV